jgi:hypothetical protein
MEDNLMSAESQVEKELGENGQALTSPNPTGTPAPPAPYSVQIRSAWESLRIWGTPWWERIQKGFTWWGVLSFPVKMLLTGFAGLVVGPGVITFFSGFGTYVFAWYYGVRIPSEGTPHIQATVGYISFLLLLTVGFGFLGIWLFSKLLARMTRGLLTLLAPRFMTSRADKEPSFKAVLVFSIWGGGLLCGLTSLFWAVMVKSGDNWVFVVPAAVLIILLLAGFPDLGVHLDSVFNRIDRAKKSIWPLGLVLRLLGVNFSNRWGWYRFALGMLLIGLFVVNLGFALGLISEQQEADGPSAGNISRILFWVFLVGYLVTLMAWKPWIIWYAAMAGALMFVTTSVALSLCPSSYGWFLRAIGHGGGATVTLTVQEDGISKAKEFEGNLMLRTSQAVILYDPAEGVMREFPMSQVSEIRHEAVGLANIPYQLP